MKNIFIWLAIIFFFTNTSWAQKAEHSIFHLHNGSIYIGSIISEQNHEITLSLDDGETLTFPKHKVKYYLDTNDIIAYPNGKYHHVKGFFFNTSIGINMENIFTEENNLISSHLPFIFGHYLNSKFAVGVGFAFEFNEAEISGFRLDTQFAPLFIYGRHYLGKTKKRSFIYGRLGYGFRGDDGEFTNDHEGGVQFQFGGGIHFSSRRKTKFILSLGYHLQKTNGAENFIDPFGNEIFTEYNIWIRRLILKFGAELSWKKKKFI
jgi:hypothetical protein